MTQNKYFTLFYIMIRSLVCFLPGELMASLMDWELSVLWTPTVVLSSESVALFPPKHLLDCTYLWSTDDSSFDKVEANFKVICQFSLVHFLQITECFVMDNCLNKILYFRTIWDLFYRMTMWILLYLAQFL